MIETLIKIAKFDVNTCFTDEDLHGEFPERIDRVHDWRNHITSKLQDIWKELTIETKLALIIQAQTEADKEEGD